MTCNFKWCATFFFSFFWFGGKKNKNKKNIKQLPTHKKRFNFPRISTRQANEWEREWDSESESETFRATNRKKKWQTKEKVQSIMEMDSFCDKNFATNKQANKPADSCTHTYTSIRLDWMQRLCKWYFILKTDAYNVCDGSGSTICKVVIKLFQNAFWNREQHEVS